MEQKIDQNAVVQKVVLSSDSLRFQVPFAMSISGPSQGLSWNYLNRNNFV